MSRPSRFTSQTFIDAAIALVAEGGPTAATLTSIARKAGAPTGSIYYRFESRVAILATAWISAHGDFARCMRAALNEGSGLLAALMIPHWARENGVHARFLLLNEPRTLFGEPPPTELGQEISRQERELESAFDAYVQRTEDAEVRARARFLIFDGPIALVSPHLAGGGPIPGFIDGMIRAMHGSIQTAA